MLYYYVSIPNGMEFYCGQGGFTRHRSSVSIPNGMEFYQISHLLTQGVESFNSPTGWNSTQKTQTTKAKPIVSIPNGMEFYGSHRSWCALFRHVSIPNGMEFYACEKRYLAPKKSFNSQRDGILQLNKRSYLGPLLMFQVPTGWNSTLPFRYIQPSEWVSIPNGMEFYRARRSAEF